MNLSDDTRKKPGFWQIVGSVLAAALGVQSHKNRERDFRHGNVVAYIVAGVIFAACFVGGLILLANYLVAANS